MKNKYTTLVILLLGSLTFFTGCYYDNEEDLNVGSNFCDTTNITYTKDISVIFSQNCNICHSASIASGGIITDNYDAVKGEITRIHGAVNHLDGFIGMPKDQPPLPACELSKIDAWINNQLPQ